MRFDATQESLKNEAPARARTANLGNPEDEKAFPLLQRSRIRCRPEVKFDGLLPARFDLWKMGGSHAQRDVMDWTLAEAAVRGNVRDVALSLAHERLASRPDSVPNRRFLREAEAINRFQI